MGRRDTFARVGRPRAGLALVGCPPLRRASRSCLACLSRLSTTSTLSGNISAATCLRNPLNETAESDDPASPGCAAV